MCFLDPIWRSFQDIPSDAEASWISGSCLYSLATLEIAREPAMKSLALTERRQPDLWRWAIVCIDGQLVEEGWESTQKEAKRAAVTALEHEMGRLKPEYSTAV
jgi:hypothetical protein